MVDGNRFRGLLVGIAAGDIQTQLPLLGCAMDLAVMFRSRLTVYIFAPTLMQPFPLTLGSSSIWIAQETKQIEDMSRLTAQSVQELASQAGVDVVVEHAFSPYDEEYRRFADLARLHDLTILPAVGSSETPARKAIECALFDTGRPVIVVPPARGRMPGKTAIAWDGSARAARAVRDNLDALMIADQVTIVTVLDAKGQGAVKSSDGLVRYLALYGIVAKIAPIANQKDSDEGQLLREFLVREHFDLLVMGAFVHSRLRQAVLGGMTRSLLDKCPIPVMMAY